MTRPNPGSDLARSQGCACPVMDNGRGKFPPFPPDGWWVNGDCPMHGLAAYPPAELDDMEG